MKFKNGFTLVELLVSIAIIATLTAILLPNFMGARERAEDAKRISDMGTLKNALRTYYNDHQAYPTAAAGMINGTAFSQYMPAVSNLGYGYTYESINGSDGFNLCVPLNVGKSEVEVSWNKCGVGSTRVCGNDTGRGKQDVYVICAN